MSAPSIGGLFKEKRSNWALPGPVVLVASPTAMSIGTRKVWRDVLSFAVDVLDLRAWRTMDPLACVMLACFVAVVAQPLVYGNLGRSFAALMTPVK